MGYKFLPMENAPVEILDESIAKKTWPIMRSPTKGTKMHILKKFIKAVVLTYAFIFMMMIGLIFMTNMLLATSR